MIRLLYQMKVGDSLREITTVVDTADYGKIRLRLGKVASDKGISKTALAKAAGADYRVIKRMVDDNLAKVDLDVLARVCYVLECSVADVMVFEESTK